MFSNLSKGSVLYGLDTKGGIKVFNATVETVSIPRPRFMQNTFGQLPEMVLDIVANVNGERKEYKEIPVNNAIADFGPNTFVLSEHKSLIPQYENVLGELDPASANDNAVKELKGQVETMQNQLAEALALLKQKTANPV